MPRYWQPVEAPLAHVQGYAHLTNAIRIYTATAALYARNPILRDIELGKRLKIDLILHRMWRDFEELALKSSSRADAAIKARIRQTQVRPDTPGPHMIDNVVSRPIPTRLPYGSFGIADIEVLDRTVNPRAPQAGPYWAAQEYGTSAHVGRKVPGYFMPGRARPAAGEFRLHPVFEQATGKGTPAMVIRRPIQARHFLRDGTVDALAHHFADEKGIVARMALGLARV